MTRFHRRIAAFGLIVGFVAAACGGQPPVAPGGGSSYPTKTIDIMAPAAPGGGFDQTARLIQKALTDEKIVNVNVTVSNKPGAGGTVGMAEVIKNAKGDPHQLIVVGRVTIGSQITGKTEAKVSQLTPIARLMGETEVITTSANSRFRTIKDVMDALKSDVNSVKFGGGSAGGIDHELAARLVKEAGGNVSAWKSYVAFPGGGEASAAIIGGQVDVGISGYGEFKGHIDSGRMRGLAVSSDARLSGVNIPTLKESQVNIGIVNWRLLAAPPDVPAADLPRLQEIAKKVTSSKVWQDFAKTNNWFENFTTEGLTAYVGAETTSLTAALTELGLVK